MVVKPERKLGMVISDSWLQTYYDVDFRRYLLENYKVKALIDISPRVFPVPLIGTCVLLLERPAYGMKAECPTCHRYECPSCNLKFNLYESTKDSFTISKLKVDNSCRIIR